MGKYKLNFELIPDSCWFSNLRSELTKSQWDMVRFDAYRRAGGKCRVCGRAVRLEAHEVWKFDETTQTQVLTDVTALCHDCHSVVHIGRTQLMGDEERACKWFMQVNGCTYADYRAALGEANEAHIRRNRVGEWKLDLTWLYQRFPSCIPAYLQKN